MRGPAGAAACAASAASSSRAVTLPQWSRISPRRAVSSGSSRIRRTYSETWLCGGKIVTRQSSRTKSKAPSSVALSAPLRRAISKPRKQDSGSMSSTSPAGS